MIITPLQLGGFGIVCILCTICCLFPAFKLTIDLNQSKSFIMSTIAHNNNNYPRKIFMLILGIVIIMLMMSCNTPTRPYEAKVRIIENGTVTVIDFTVAEANHLVTGDTIWVDLATHTLNDTSNTTMKGVIQ